MRPVLKEVGCNEVGSRTNQHTHAAMKRRYIHAPHLLSQQSLEGRWWITATVGLHPSFLTLQRKGSGTRRTVAAWRYNSPFLRKSTPATTAAVRKAGGAAQDDSGKFALTCSDGPEASDRACRGMELSIKQVCQFVMATLGETVRSQMRNRMLRINFQKRPSDD